MNDIIKKLLPYLIIVIVVILLRIFIVMPVRVTGTSMEPNIHSKEIMILVKITKYFKEYERNDIIVVKDDDDYLIKRIIGLPGDIITCDDNIIYINGKKYDDKYSKGVTVDFSKVVLGKNEYFVLGDNREVSLDSRSIGNVKKDEILGYANLVIYPFNNIRIVD